MSTTKESESDSVSRFRLRRTLEMLAEKEGRGTELISLYIPPGRRIHDVMANLREEYGTASNIKSRTTRKNVQDSIDRVSQRLKLFKEPPENGLVIFCGAIPRNGAGSEKMETYVLVPPEPINVYFYRCDARFHTEPLQVMVNERNAYGIIVIDTSDAIVATVRGQRMEILQKFSSGVAGKHRAGGQSARRFERIREQSLNEYYHRVANHTYELLNPVPGLKGIIIGGPGPTKHEFVESDYLNYMLKQKILATIDTSYVGEQGVDEVVSKSQEILKGVRYSEEKRLVQKFLYEIGHETGLGVYGETQVRKYLNAGIVDLLIVSEKISTLHVYVKCKNCGATDDALIPQANFVKFEQDLMSSTCKKCNSAALAVDDFKDLVDELIEIADKQNAKIAIISTETDEGIMLKDSFGGIAAILRYRPS
ncbi:MAG: peptide chain release factor aRF-1 [Candidatus Bathyarchaeia archaeon]|jgi:peptide chain release factor subunit 1|nr:peptide chain release factor aRF-1 [Candidatus Bathyarchaeia archaeon]